jgi:hypothetical protein
MALLFLLMLAAACCCLLLLLLRDRRTCSVEQRLKAILPAAFTVAYELSF